MPSLPSRAEPAGETTLISSQIRGLGRKRWIQGRGRNCCLPFRLTGTTNAQAQRNQKNGRYDLSKHDRESGIAKNNEVSFPLQSRGSGVCIGSGQFIPHGKNFNPGRIGSKVHEVLLDAGSPAIAQRLVVSRGAFPVAVSFNEDFGAWVIGKIAGYIL